MPNAMAFYRVARRCHQRGVPLLPALLQALIFLLYNSVVSFEAEIGRHSTFAHGGIGVVLQPGVRLGRNVLIGQGVTIGGRSRQSGMPWIGDDVYIGAGARVLGDLTVGSGSIITTNAVVVDDVPARSIVAGIPARVVREHIDIREYEDLPRGI